MKTLTLAIAGLMLAATTAFAGSDATYRVTFNSTWTARSNPLEYPANAHHSGMVGATHGSGYALFRAGGIATDGLKALSERGAHSPFDKEVRAAIEKGAAGAFFESDPIFGPPGKSVAMFRIDDAHPMVSVAAMIAPSPDWFTGVANLSLKQEGKWMAKKTVTVYAWDAGTDSGTTYAAADAPTEPRQPVASSESPHFVQDGRMVPVGTLVFEKIAEMPGKMPAK
jgi:hypothetical protein